MVIAVAGTAVETNADIQKQFALHPGPTTVTVLRKLDKTETEELPIDVPGRPLRRLGLVMEPGPIVAVQDASPAASADVKKGDILVTIDGQPIGDPETLNDRLLGKVGQTIPIGVRRDGKDIDLNIALREPFAVELPLVDGEPMAIATMGIALEITNRVASLVPDGPAEKAGIKPGDRIVEAKILKATLDVGLAEPIELKELTTKFGPDKLNWPVFAEQLQSTTPESKVELTLEGGRTATVTPVATDDWFADRGLIFEPLLVERRATSLGDAVALGANETVESVGQVYRFLRAIGTQQVSAKGMAGPLTIFGVAHQSASKGLSDLLIFLGMLSANLAVLNFLPIPLLDGGHMVFLALEGIRGKPVSERVVVAFHYAGFLFIIGLMAFVFALDLNLIPRMP